MPSQCSLCTINQEDYRIVERAPKVYSIIPNAPFTPGHVMILPYRHTVFEGINGEELSQLRDMSCRLKGKLVALYPRTPPIFTSMLDTIHASVPDHLHFHLIPSPVNIIALLASYYKITPERRILPRSELEKLAQQLR